MDVLDTHKEGPTLIVISSVHGGEVAGRQVQAFLQYDLGILSHMTCGRVILILGNLEGYRKYLTTRDHPQARIVDENMNRACTSENLEHGTSSEAQSASELSPILQQADFMIDLHSVGASPSLSMSILSQNSM